MEPKSKLKALLVGINDYPQKDHRLNGCVNDVKTMHRYLTEFCNTETYEPDIRVLTNEKATRANIIQHFLEHLGSLTTNDIGLFYFSGHGSEHRAPTEFWHNHPSRKFETLVCYDSRPVEGHGYDLMDKELRWLIWKVSQNNKDSQHPLTIILDCCHSGGGFRGGGLADTIDKELEEKTREIPGAYQAPHWSKYLGAKDYKVNKDQVDVPEGNYIALAACLDDQFAKEQMLPIKSRGVFTYCLLAALENVHAKISYTELRDATKAQVVNMAKEQFPKIWAVPMANQNRLFLGGAMQDKKTWHLVYHDQAKGWMMEAGHLLGLSSAEKGKILTFPEEYPNNELHKHDQAIGKIKIKKVFPNYCSIEGMDGQDITKRFKAIFVEPLQRAMPIALLPEGDAEGKQHFLAEWKNIASKELRLTDDADDALYVVRANNESYTIQSHLDDLPLYPTVANYNSQTAHHVIRTLETIAQWQGVKTLSNPENDILDSEYSIELFEVTSATKDFMKVLKEHPLDASQEINLSYRFNAEISDPEYQWEEPMFRVCIKAGENNPEKLWISALHLGADFGISNQLLLPVSLSKGEAVWLEFTDPDTSVPTTLIPLQVEDAYLNEGVKELTERFKIIISREKLDTEKLEQDGLSLDPGPMERTRGTGRKPRRRLLLRDDWTTFDFTIKVSLDKSKGKL